MQEICTKTEELANGILQGAGFDLRASAAESEQGCLLSIDGPDNGLLLNQGGELLDALQQILNQAYGRDLPKGQRIVCDADNFASMATAKRCGATFRDELISDWVGFPIRRYWVSL